MPKDKVEKYQEALARRGSRLITKSNKSENYFEDNKVILKYCKKHLKKNKSSGLEKAITIIYSSTRNLAQNILTKDAAVAIMVTTDHFAKAICAQFRNPIAFLTTTSASKTTATPLSEISNTAISSADYVVKTQQAKKNTAQLPALIKLKKGNLFEIIRK